MPDLEAASNRNRHAKEWLQERVRQLNNVEWLPLSVREHFARDVPELVEEIKRLRSSNDILMKWFLASEQDRVAMQAIVDAATSWYRSTPDVQEQRATEAIAIAVYEHLARPDLPPVREVPQIPWKRAMAHYSTEVKFNVHPVTGEVSVRDSAVGTWATSLDLSPEEAIDKGLALLRAGLQARVLSSSPTDPEIKETP